MTAGSAGPNGRHRQAAPGPRSRRVRGRPVGGHAPTAGGLARAVLGYLDDTGADAVQVYVTNPRGWALAAGDPAQDAAFRAGCATRGTAVYVHAALLVNLGSPSPETVGRSVATLRHTLVRGAAIGARAVVFHAGSAVEPGPRSDALLRVRRALLPVLDDAAAAELPRLLVEPSAGGGRCLAGRVEQLGDYLAAVDGHPWLGVCLDTCHAWAAGHDLVTAGGMTATLDALHASVGAGRLGLVHANDAMDGCGSNRDRHATIGAGQLGAAPFAELLAHPATAGVPLIVETPGDGHRADIATLRRLARRAARTAAPTTAVAPVAPATAAASATAAADLGVPAGRTPLVSRPAGR